jgi:cytochrome c oxidase subunit 2
MRVPAGRQVELEMRSKDVIHDFYVPEVQVKQDVVPGITTRLIFDPEQPGTYQVICAELCGVGHGVMRARLIVMEPGDYEAWVAQAKAQVAREAQRAQQGQQGQGQAAPGGGGAAPATTAPATTAPATP